MFLDANGDRPILALKGVDEIVLKLDQIRFNKVLSGFL